MAMGRRPQASCEGATSPAIPHRRRVGVGLKLVAVVRHATEEDGGEVRCRRGPLPAQRQAAADETAGGKAAGGEAA
eukprot:6770085-Prymnesium_polylepis.1